MEPSSSSISSQTMSYSKTKWRGGQRIHQASRGDLRTPEPHPQPQPGPGPVRTVVTPQTFFFFSFRACSQLGDDPSDLECRGQRSQGKSEES